MKKITEAASKVKFEIQDDTINYISAAELKKYLDVAGKFLSEETKETLLRPTSDSVKFINHSINGDFDIPLYLQSKGTLKYIRILNALYDMITHQHVYYLDELGEDFAVLLSKCFPFQFGEISTHYYKSRNRFAFAGFD